MEHIRTSLFFGLWATVSGQRAHSCHSGFRIMVWRMWAGLHACGQVKLLNRHLWSESGWQLLQWRILCCVRDHCSHACWQQGLWSSRLQFHVMAADAMLWLLVRFYVGLAVLRGMNGAESGWWLGMLWGCDFSAGAAGGKMACVEAGKHHPDINHPSWMIQIVTSGASWPVDFTMV